MHPSSLPIDDVLPQLIAAVKAHSAVVLKAPTGAGKTTRVPPALLDAGTKGLIVMLEPRRVAARAAARRIAAERGSQVGGEIGYQVRFERKASNATRILVVTEGVLLRMLEADPLLERVGAVVFDEFHERSLSADLALALTQHVRTSVREDLRVVVMSATVDPSPIAAFLSDAPVIESEGRAFPVEIENRAQDGDTRIEDAVRSAVLNVMARSEGDVLVFLPGVGEIKRCARSLGGIERTLGAEVLELHGELPPERQDAVVAEGKGRRVILATNVAETSLTIPGVRVVIDAGLERVPRVDPSIGLSRLETVRISRESADQRAGRAGRTAPGLCVRLWSRSEDARLEARREPEIRRADLSGALLQLLSFGETDLENFPWFEAPRPHTLEAALALLQRLGALQDGRLTALGSSMAAIPTHPRLARLLLESKRVGHRRRLALAAAVLSDRSPFVPMGRGESAEHHSVSDVLDAVEALEAYEDSGRLDAGARRLRRGPAKFALRARNQLARTREEDTQKGDPDEAVLRAVLAAYPDRVAKRRAPGDERAVMVGGRGVRLDRSSSVREPELFVCVETDGGRRGQRSEAWVRSASGIERSWLPGVSVQTESTAGFDSTLQAVTGMRRTRYEDLVLEETAVQIERGPQVEHALAEAAGADLGTALPLDDDGVVGLRTRVACLRGWMPDLELPDMDEEAIRALLPALVRGRRSFAELRKAPLLQHLKGLLSWQQQQRLDREAPEHIEVPSGSRIRVTYESGRPPVLAVRVQEVFGLTETPTVASGRVKVLMHLLAPNYRPQQITDDMPSFWTNTYPSVRAELRRRYPKHAWPEDPLTATPRRRPGRRR